MLHFRHLGVLPLCKISKRYIGNSGSYGRKTHLLHTDNQTDGWRDGRTDSYINSSRRADHICILNDISSSSTFVRYILRGEISILFSFGKSIIITIS